MRSDPIAPRNIGPAAVVLHDFLLGLGCTEIEFIKTKHIRVSWMTGPRKVSMSMSCTPRDDDTCARNAIRIARRKIAEVCSR